MTLPAKTENKEVFAKIEQALVTGDLSRLTPEERVAYYKKTCESLGLNPYTKPFEYITLNGKLQLYALRACADQLRQLKGVSLEIVSQELRDDLFTIHVRASIGGRIDEEIGAVPLLLSHKGEARANQVMKAITKAKRRATLSICGLGWLDESELEGIPRQAIKEPSAVKAASTPAATDEAPGTATQPPSGGSPYRPQPGQTPRDREGPALTIDPDPQTGEVFDPPGGKVGTKENLFYMARAAADNGSDTFWNSFYIQRTEEEQNLIKNEPGLGKELRKRMNEHDNLMGSKDD